MVVVVMEALPIAVVGVESSVDWSVLLSEESKMPLANSMALVALFGHDLGKQFLPQVQAPRLIL